MPIGRIFQEKDSLNGRWEQEESQWGGMQGVKRSVFDIRPGNQGEVSVVGVAGRLVLF